MADNPIRKIAKRAKGYTEEIVAEVVGDANLQEEGRRDIAAGRSKHEAAAIKTGGEPGRR